MAKAIQFKQNSFSGGISDSPRKIVWNGAFYTSDEFRVSKHFDIFTDPKRLIPYRSFEADTNDGSSSTGMKQYLVRDFLYGTSAGRLFGLGQTSGGLTKFFFKEDPTTGNWTVPSSGEGNGLVRNGCFVEYINYLWGFQGTNQVFKYGDVRTVTPAVTNTVGTVGTITSVAQGIIGKDDNLYLPYNNKLARISSAGALTDAVLTLPSNLKITSLANKGNYLAIGCTSISTFNSVSKVFLWNFTSPDVQEQIDWGEGALKVLETVEDVLVGVTDRYLNNSVGAGRGSILIQVYQGGSVQKYKEFFTLKLSGKEMPISKVLKDNRLFFTAKIMTNTAGTEYIEGIWSFGRKNVNYPYTFTLDYIDENVDTDGIQAFGTAANFFFIGHSDDGSIDKTDDSSAYTFSSVLESQIVDFGSVDNDKTLKSIKVYFRSLASGESLTVKYRVDGTTSWTTVGTVNTTGLLSRTFLNIESTGAVFSGGKEFEVQLNSTGGLEVTGFEMEADLLNVP